MGRPHWKVKSIQNLAGARGILKKVVNIPTYDRGKAVSPWADGREICNNNLDRRKKKKFKQTSNGNLCSHGTDDSAKTIGIELHRFVEGEPGYDDLLVAHFVLDVYGRHDRKVFMLQFRQTRILRICDVGGKTVDVTIMNKFHKLFKPVIEDSMLNNKTLMIIETHRHFDTYMELWRELMRIAVDIINCEGLVTDNARSFFSPKRNFFVLGL
jgi:hypothetical protein